MFLTQNQQEVIFCNRSITLLIAVVKCPPIAAAHFGVEAEIEPFFFQTLGGHFYFTARVKRIQDTAIFSEYGVDFPNISARLTVQAVVVGAAALIGTEFLVNSSQKRRAAFRTCSFAHGVKL